MFRAQTAAEYVTLVALMFVLVAALMLVSFRQQEVTMAISTVRLSCIEYSSQNTSVACYEIRYYYSGSQNVTIVPISTAITQNQKNDLQYRMMERLISVFRPGESPSGKCMLAGYYSYCVEIP